ncbi:MAG: sulfatase-like hydrolase/transferase [candidate division Zixibacteria bacterium]|nr:sulfatase-like hydrolase/transferase [candidate division Zixibacteria bacterium]
MNAPGDYGMSSENPSMIIKIYKYIINTLVPGFLAGAVAGIGETIYLSIVTERVLMRSSLFFYPFLGTVAVFLFSIIIGILSLFIKGIYRTKGLSNIYFTATLVLMIFSIIPKVIFQQFGFPSSMLLSYLLSLVFVALFFFAGLGMLLLFRNFSRLIKIPWQFSGVILYVLITAIISVSAFSTTGSDVKFEPYDMSENDKVSDKPYVLFIIIDALRFDWLSLTGYDIDTPNFDKFAEDGIYYPNAIANCSWTKPSIASIITSMYPFQHNALTEYDVLNPEVSTIGEIMRDLGYYTIGYHNNLHIGVANNFHQGFNHYQSLFPFKKMKELPKSDFRLFSLHRPLLAFFLSKSSPKQITRLYYLDGVATSQRVIDWISTNRDKKFFFFLHYMDPHSPYFVHPFNGVKYDPYKPEHFDPQNPTPEDIERIKEVYRQEVVYTDKALGNLMDYLKEINLYDSTLIAIISDHGEEFYEHQGWIHARTLYDEVIRIPMLIKFPFSEMGGTIDSSLVQSIDLAPTLLSYLGTEIPGTWEGVDLLNRDSWEWTISHTNKKHDSRSLRDLDEKLYIAYSSDLPDSMVEKKLRSIPPLGYYRLDKDPLEQNNLANAPEYSQRVTELKDSLVNMVNALKANSVEGISVELDPATKAQLKALGYID